MKLSELDRKIISLLQQGLSSAKEPYRLIAQKAGISQEDLVSKIIQYQEKGLIRRVAVVLDHNKVGMKTNVLVCWQVPLREVEEAGKTMASFPQITHCYFRASAFDWPYNLYTMIHGQTKRQCEQVIKEIAQKTSLNNYKLLYTKREFKKAAMKYE